MAGRSFIGTSGYQYEHWKERFYPTGMPKTRWFNHYAQHFDTVELNVTFYNLPKLETFERWAEQAPPDFCYAVKYNRYGTHMKRLRDPVDHLRNFLERAQALGPYLGPILVQLSPQFKVNVPRLAAFLEAAPGTYRWAVEFRDASWLCDATYELLRQHNAALCMHDLIPEHPEVMTADWVYLRYHGASGNYRYNTHYLTVEAERIRKYLRAGRDTYAYFNNDLGGHAIDNAFELREYVEGKPRS